MKQEQEYRQPMPGSVFTAQDEMVGEAYSQLQDWKQKLEEKYGKEYTEKAILQMAEEVKAE